MSPSGSGGGPAAVGGFEFQHRISAWVAVRILAERGASSSWQLPSSTTLEWLRCETEQPVDDLMVGTSTGGNIFCQIKRSLDLSEAANSELSSVISQFVRQFLSCRDCKPGKRSWERPLDSNRDRLVLITGPQASGHIRFELNTVLARLRSLLNSQDIRDAASSQEETRALSLLLQHLGAAWSASVGVQPSDVEIRQFLSLFRIDVMDADPDGALQHEAKDLLANSVLLRAEDSESVWRIIVSACAQFSQQRSGAGRNDFQKLILNTGIDIRAANSFQSDIERLQQYSVSTFDLLSHLSQIHLGDRLIKIQRASTAELRSVAAEGSVVVVGQPGAGKSGALHDLVGEFRRDAIDYVFLAVDRLEISSIQQIRSVLGLEHELANVLANWPGRNPAFLIIDALDAARTEPAGRAFRDLIRQVAKLDRWHIVASIRKFDLRYSNECRQLFSGTPSTNFKDVEFPDVRHVNVPTLTDEELAQIEPQSGELYALAKGLPKELREILFNLRLLAELLGAGVNRELFTPIRTQLDLLDLYWSYRVIRQDSLAANRESVLLCICQEMVRTRVLFANKRWLR